MILLSILASILVIAVVAALVVTLVTSISIITTFSDLIVFALIVWVLIRLFRRRK